jgi:hypothetical protein
VHERDGRGAQAVIGLQGGVVGVDARREIDDGEGIVQEGEAVGQGRDDFVGDGGEVVLWGSFLLVFFLSSQGVKGLWVGTYLV